MKSMKTFVLILVLMFAIPVSANDSEWLAGMKRIELLSHNRADVLKILGTPVDNETKDYAWYYDFRQGRITITFETGTCSENKDTDSKPIGWKVPEWTVVEVSFSPEKPIKPKKVGINFNGFTKTPVKPSASFTPDDVKRAPFNFEYINEDSGMYLFEEYGKFSEIRFFPPKRFNHLRCSE